MASVGRGMIVPRAADGAPFSSRSASVPAVVAARPLCLPRTRLPHRTPDEERHGACHNGKRDDGIGRHQANPSARPPTSVSHAAP